MDVDLFGDAIGGDAGQNRGQSRLVGACLTQEKRNAKSFSAHFNLFLTVNITIEKPGTFGANQCNSTHRRKSVVHFCLSLPCTTIRHTERMLSSAAFCNGTKTKRSRISFIFMQVFSPRHSSSKAWLCTRLIENVDIQNRLLPVAQPCPTKKVLQKGPRGAENEITAAAGRQSKLTN